MSTTRHLPTQVASRVRGLSAILRRRAAAQRAWPNPERSVGRLICKVGNESIWEAQGDARETFKSIAADIKHYLDRCVEPIPSWVTWSIYMIGCAVGSAHPTIVFCCEVVAHRREVRNIIKQSGILDRYPGIKTGHMPRAPGFDHLIPLAPSSSSNKGRIELEMSRHAPGMLLAITSCADGQRRSTKATIGGVVRIGCKYFYTTAAHPFQTDLDLGNSSEPPAFMKQSNGDTEDDACSFDGDSDTASELEEGIASASGDQTPLNAKHQEASEHEMPKSTEPTPDYETSLGSNRFINELAFDYPGEMFIISQGSPGVEADFALLEVTESHHQVQNVVSRLADGNYLTVTSLSMLDSHDVPPIIHVLAITARGNIRGQLSSTPFYTRSPYDKTFQNMLYATFRGTLEIGDCGAWVVDRDTGGLYGHIVAGSPNLGTALIKPFHDVFEHIRHRTGYLPTFPTNRAEEHFLSGPWGATHLRTNDMPPMTSIIPQGDNTKSIRQYVENSTEEKVSTTVSTIGEPICRPSFPGSQSEAENINKKGKAVQGKAAIKKPEPHMHRVLFNSREGQKAKRLVYPALLYPKRDVFGLPTYTPLPTQPSQHSARTSQRFCNLLYSLSRTPLGWEKSGLLDEALKRIPISRIYNDAENEFNTLNAIAMSLEASRPQWGYQDCVVRALMRWFRKDYFTWVNHPACDHCFHPTVSQGETSPTPEESIFGALRVELYECTNRDCARFTRFPRYSDPWILLETCRGRVGEWVHVFSLFCRAIGARTRWVWSAEDHLWVEVYSKHVARWVHVDVLEGVWDDPVLYTERWGKALSYCIAFSTEGATDVTRRYVREEKKLKPRNKSSELALFYMLKKITTERRDKLSKEDRERLRLGDTTEQEELQTFRVLSVSKELIASLAPPSEPGPSQHRPRPEESRNLSPKLVLEEKWLEDTRKLMDDYCEWDSVSPHR
ncbi:hypothetical protein F5Y08DRAFT_250231 [Xylaria arbuscula]|nr:hypothetical protein F5Y08DRAFT_250231 [Xylaria arbuscula]